MNILYITPLLPYPLHSGGQVRFYHLLKRLSASHRIHLVTFIRNESERDLVRNLSFIARISLFYRGKRFRPVHVVRSLLRANPFLVGSYDHPAARDFVSKELNSGMYDLVHLEPFYTYPVLPKSLSLPLVVAEHNVEAEVYERYAGTAKLPLLSSLIRLEAAGIRRREETVLKKAGAVIAVSPEDRTKLMKNFGVKNVTVVPNGVDVSWFSEKKPVKSEIWPRLLFVGNFQWLPNREAVAKLTSYPWDRLKKDFPGLKVTVVGQHAPADLKQKMQCAGIIYHDRVDDIRDAFTQADIFLAIMGVAGGSKYKCLEAMAAGVPVVATQEAVEGLAAKSGDQYLSVRDFADLPAALNKLKGRDLAVQLVKNARVFVRKHYDWERIAATQAAVWESVV